ncbi:MAG: hypothetical protein KGZ93_03945 [Actinobacteria bacterium]|nr:hypothetical protein [Actinomycetota bacterium]
MQNFRHASPAPCIVNEGILINKKDMRRALETLESVKYTYNVDGDTISEGEGVVVKVFSNAETSTLIVNGCIFLNILSFNYLRFFPHDNNLSVIELVDDIKILKLTPVEEDNKRANRVNREIFAAAHYDEEVPAELFDEIDDDDRL